MRISQHFWWCQKYAYIAAILFFEPLKFQLCWSNLVFYRHGSATRVSKQPMKKVGSLSYANRDKHTAIINIQGLSNLAAIQSRSPQ